MTYGNELQFLEGSADTIPTTVTVDGEPMTTGYKVQLVRFETGVEVVDLSDTGDWKIAPPSAAGYDEGYYCVFTRLDQETGPPIIDHAGHVRIVRR